MCTTVSPNNYKIDDAVAFEVNDGMALSLIDLLMRFQRLNEARWQAGNGAVRSFARTHTHK